MNDPRITKKPWLRCLPRIVRPLAYPPMAIFEMGLLFLSFMAALLNRELAARIVCFAGTLPDPRDYSWSNRKVNPECNEELWYVAFRRARGDSWVITRTTLDLDDDDDLVEWIRLEEESRGENIVLVFWKKLNQKGQDDASA